jgi:antitoxin MazE9
MKVSVSIPDQDIEFLDEYARKTGLESRSAALQKAVRLLRTSELREAYAAAWEEFDQAGDAALWETTVGDGLEGR